MEGRFSVVGADPQRGVARSRSSGLQKASAAAVVRREFPGAKFIRNMKIVAMKIIRGKIQFSIYM